MNLVKKATDLLEERHPGGELLYLIKFGSHLYGLNTPESDVDLKGIFLPNFESLVTQKKIRSINYTTGKNVDKNTSDDIDIELWSLQYWLELVSKGDTSGLDLLYSVSNDDIILSRNPVMDKIFNNPFSLFNPQDTQAYVGYCIGQAKKYGVKGSRLGVIKQVSKWIYNYIDNLDVLDPAAKLIDIMYDIEKHCGDPSYCFIKEMPYRKDIGTTIPYLIICEKQHQSTITIDEFYTRIQKIYETYGERARLAEQNKGMDYKALSHALRCIKQCEQLLTEGEITFPFKDDDLHDIMKIKLGDLPWNEIEPMIVNGLEDINKLQKVTTVTGHYNEKFVRDFVMSLYT